jgi:hypothetical protein
MQRYTLFITAQIFFLKFLIFSSLPLFSSSGKKVGKCAGRSKEWTTLHNLPLYSCRAVHLLDRPTRFAAVIVTPFEVSKVRLVLQRVEHPAHFGPFLLLVLQPLEHQEHHPSPGGGGPPDGAGMRERIFFVFLCII